MHSFSSSRDQNDARCARKSLKGTVIEGVGACFGLINFGANLITVQTVTIVIS